MAQAQQQPERYTGETLPAWSLPAAASETIGVSVEWPERVTRDWALGGSTGAGVRVCILDSGVQADHPLVGSLDGAVALHKTEEGEIVVEEDTEGDLAGHGTACAGIVRSLAPDCRLFSVRVLGAGFKGSGAVLLDELADSAYFRRTVIVASAHNMPVESYPWRFSSVISVGSHEERDPLTFFYNPAPPVEFFGRGVNVEVAWIGGARIRSSGNSFATPHMSGICTLILAKHPELTPFQLKSVLYLTATNVGGAKR